MAKMAKSMARSTSSGGRRKACASNVALPAASSAMTKPVKTDKWKPIACQPGFVVHGGLLKKPAAVDMVEKGGESYIKVNKRDNWVCQVVAGKSCGGHPLQRTSVIEALLSGVESLNGGRPEFGYHGEQQDSGVGGSPLPGGRDVPQEIVDMGYGDVIDCSLMPAVKCGSRKQAVPGQMRCRRQAVPCDVDLGLPFGREHGDPVRVLSCMPNGRATKGTVLIHVDDVPWLLAQLSGEVASGGVDYHPEESLMRRPYFSHRDRCWVVRAKTPAGVCKRKSFAVPAYSEDAGGVLLPLSKQARADVMHGKYGDALSWQQKIEQGDNVE
jgi:hypothetical protein